MRGALLRDAQFDRRVALRDLDSYRRNGPSPFVWVVVLYERLNTAQ